VDGNGDPRKVTVTIPNEAFSSRKVRFQDAPEFAVARVQRAVDSDGDFRDGLELVVTPTDLDEYREAQARRTPERKPRAPRSTPH
jgi:hypothetical protein